MLSRRGGVARGRQGRESFSRGFLCQVVCEQMKASSNPGAAQSNRQSGQARRPAAGDEWRAKLGVWRRTWRGEHLRRAHVWKGHRSVSQPLSTYPSNAHYSHVIHSCARGAVQARLAHPAHGKHSKRDQSKLCPPPLSTTNFQWLMYCLATSQVSVVLEELKAVGAIPGYEVVPISFAKNEQKADWFIEINPNGRIPALLHNRPGGKGPINVWEVCALRLGLKAPPHGR